MSYATLHGFRPDGEIFNHKTYGNAYHGCMLIWLEMGKKYGISDPVKMLYDKTTENEVWSLASNPKVTPHDQITMMTTFDRYLVWSKDLPRLVEYLKKSAEWLPKHCHIHTQIRDIEEVINQSDIIAIGWNGTSVVRVWDSEEWENEDDYVRYNLYNHKRHFDLFEQFDKPQELEK